MNKVFDFLSLMQIPLGFLTGLILLLILELFSLGFWTTATVLLTSCLLFFAWSYLADRFSFDAFDWIATSKKQREMNARIDARDRQIGRYAFPLGMVLAFAAAQVWSPLQIAEAVL